MPIYEFECEKCGKKEERIISRREIDAAVECEDCGNIMKRLFPNTMEFILVYNPVKDRVTWSAEGYATTQRYREYDKQAKRNIFVQPGGKTE